MPLYEYECSNCGHYLEAMQKLSDPPLKKCPACGKAQLQRLISAPVFRLKGSGWYETDFKSEKEDKRNLAERPEGEKKEGAEPAKEGEAAKAEKSEASGEKAAKPEVVRAPSKKVDLGAKRASGQRSATHHAGAHRAAKPAARAKKAVKRAGRSARRR